MVGARQTKEEVDNTSWDEAEKVSLTYATHEGSRDLICWDERCRHHRESLQVIVTFFSAVDGRIRDGWCRTTEEQMNRPRAANRILYEDIQYERMTRCLPIQAWADRSGLTMQSSSGTVGYSNDLRTRCWNKLVWAKKFPNLLSGSYLHHHCSDRLSDSLSPLPVGSLSFCLPPGNWPLLTRGRQLVNWSYFNGEAKCKDSQTTFPAELSSSIHPGPYY